MISDLLTEKLSYVVSGLSRLFSSRSGQGNGYKLEVAELIEEYFTEKEDDPNDIIEWGGGHNCSTTVVSMRSDYSRKINGKYFKTDNLVQDRIEANPKTNPKTNLETNVWILPSGKYYGKKIKTLKPESSILVDRYDRDSNKEPDTVSTDSVCNIKDTWNTYVENHVNDGSPSVDLNIEVTGVSYWQKGKPTKLVTEMPDYDRKKDGKFFMKQTPLPKGLLDIGYRSKIKPTNIKRLDADNTISDNDKEHKQWLLMKQEESLVARLPYSEPHSGVTNKKQKEVEKKELDYR